MIRICDIFETLKVSLMCLCVTMVMVMVMVMVMAVKSVISCSSLSMMMRLICRE